MPCGFAPGNIRGQRIARLAAQDQYSGPHLAEAEDRELQRTPLAEVELEHQVFDP